MLCFCSSTLWFKYGLVKEDKLVTRVNLAGAVLNFLFAATYYWHTSQRVSPTLNFAILVFPDIMRRNVFVRITCDFGSCVKIGKSLYLVSVSLAQAAVGGRVACLPDPHVHPVLCFRQRQCHPRLRHCMCHVVSLSLRLTFSIAGQ